MENKSINKIKCNGNGKLASKSCSADFPLRDVYLFTILLFYQHKIRRYLNMLLSRHGSGGTAIFRRSSPGVLLYSYFNRASDRICYCCDKNWRFGSPLYMLPAILAILYFSWVVCDLTVLLVSASRMRRLFALFLCDKYCFCHIFQPDSHQRSCRLKVELQLEEQEKWHVLESEHFRTSALCLSFFNRHVLL